MVNSAIDIPRNSSDETDYDDVMTLIGFGKVHWMLLFTCGLALMLVTNETMGMAIIALASRCDLETDSSERAEVTSAAFIGIVISSYFCGYLSDVVGRRKILLYCLCVCIIFSTISMFMTSYEWFVVIRFFVGFFLAGPTTITLMYLGEFCTTKKRPIVINYMSMFMGISMIYCPSLAHKILQYDWYLTISKQLEYRPWRFLGFLYTLPGIIATILLLFLPESPKFLMVINEERLAFDILNWMCLKNRGKSLEDFNVFKIKTSEMREDYAEGIRWYQHIWKDPAPLFHKPFVLNFLLICVVMFGLVITANGMGLWFTDMRNRFDLVTAPKKKFTVCRTMKASQITDVELDEFVCNDTFASFRDSIILGFSFIVIYNILGLLLIFIPRRIVFIVPLILSGLCGLSLIWVNRSNEIAVLFILFLAFPGVVSNLLSGAMVDFIPAYIRGKAMCFCSLSGRLGAVMGTHVLGNFLDSYCVSLFIFFASFSFLCAFLGLFLPL